LTALRRARPEDLPAIVALLADDILGQAREDAAQPLDSRYLAAFAAIAADPNQSLMAAEREGEVVATLQLTFLPGLSKKGAWRGLIEAVRVRSDWRGQGLGAELIAWAVETSRARGCAAVQLTTDKRRLDAHRFYERLGFEASHLGYRLEL
jgi:GNAT superfamily N-acetyltransferase